MLAYKWKFQSGMYDTIDLTIYEKNADVGGHLVGKPVPRNCMRCM